MRMIVSADLVIAVVFSLVGCAASARGQRASVQQMEATVFVVFSEDLRNAADAKVIVVRSLEQALAQIACRCGLNYHLSKSRLGWQSRGDCWPGSCSALLIDGAGYSI